MTAKTRRQFRRTVFGFTAIVGAFGAFRVFALEPVPIPVVAPPPVVIPAGGLEIPTIPPLPTIPATAPPAKPVETPPIPTLPDLGKRSTVQVPALPAASEKAPTPRSTAVPAVAIPKPVQIPPPPAPIPKNAPVEATPSPRPAKSTEPISPQLPALPDLRLQPAEPGLTVKPSRPEPALAIPTTPTKTTTDVPLGETPMTLAPKQVLLSALFGAALATAPVRAEEPVKQADVTAIKVQLDDLKKDIKTLQEFRKNLEDEVFGKGDGKSTTNAGLLKRVTDIESNVNNVAAMLKRIDEKLGVMAKSTSGFTPGTTPPAAKTAVRIVNDYPIEMSLMLNGKSHRLMPGEVKLVDVPAGSYTYELLHAGAQESKSAIKDGETVTLRIR